MPCPCPRTGSFLGLSGAEAGQLLLPGRQEKQSPEHQALAPGDPKTWEGRPDPGEGGAASCLWLRWMQQHPAWGVRSWLLPGGLGRCPSAVPQEGPAPKVGWATPSPVTAAWVSPVTISLRIPRAHRAPVPSVSPATPSLSPSPCSPLTPPLLLVTFAALAPCIVRAKGTTPPSH